MTDSANKCLVFRVHAEIAGIANFRRCAQIPVLPSGDRNQYFTSRGKRCVYLLINLLCHIYPGVPHQCAALFSLGLLHYMHDKTNINQHTFSYNTVTTLTTWYIHHYMHTVNYVYMFLITVVTCRCRFMFGQHYVQCI